MEAPPGKLRRVRSFAAEALSDFCKKVFCVCKLRRRTVARWEIDAEATTAQRLQVTRYENLEQPP